MSPRSGRAVRARFGLAALLLAIPLLSVTSACATMQKAASEDPMKCERDPKCNKKRDRSADCSTQCNDDPACMERCESVQAGAGNNGLGH